MVLIFWFTTAFVQINFQEEGILYHLGQVKTEKSLKPGIHIKWPWPIDRVKIYKASEIRFFTVGYEADKQMDYLWTINHGGEEYKLLLGDGKELVSINMQVHYKIGNVFDYALQYDQPEEKLKAETYHILLYETATTNLESLLSQNRTSFSQKLTKKLQEVSHQQKMGLEITDVALTSIHPPIEVASDYQQIVSAHMQKEIIITEAQTYADSLIPKAEKTKNESIAKAQVDAYNRKGQALSDAQLYQYKLKAYSLNPRAYKEGAYLKVLEKGLSGKKLYLIDKGIHVNQSSFWIDIRRLYDEDTEKAVKNDMSISKKPSLSIEDTVPIPKFDEMDGSREQKEYYYDRYR